MKAFGNNDSCNCSPSPLFHKVRDTLEEGINASNVLYLILISHHL